MKIAFYDDNMDTIKAFRKQHPHIHSVHVPNTKTTPILKNNAKFYYPLLFSQMYPNNAYAKFLVSDSHLGATPGKKNPSQLCEWVCRLADVRSGLTIPEIKAVTTRKCDVVLFDWDLTLSTCNGLLMDENAEPMSYSYSEVAQFYAGTMERFNALRAMFTELRRRGTKVYILTDNGWAKDKGVDLDRFVKVLEQFDGQITADDVVYGNNNKAETMKTNQLLSSYCHKKRKITRARRKFTSRTAKNR